MLVGLGPGFLTPVFPTSDFSDIRFFRHTIFRHGTMSDMVTISDNLCMHLDYIWSWINTQPNRASGPESFAIGIRHPLGLELDHPPTVSLPRKCITRLEILKLEYNSNFSSIFDSSFFKFEPKTQLDSKLKTGSWNSKNSSFKLKYFKLFWV